MANGVTCFEFLFPVAIVVAIIVFVLRRSMPPRTWPRGGGGRRGCGVSSVERRWTYVYGAKTHKGEQIVGRISAPSENDARTRIRNRREDPLWLRPIGDTDAIANDDEESQNTPWKCQNDKCMTMNAPHARFCKTCGTPRLRQSE